MIGHSIGLPWICCAVTTAAQAPVPVHDTTDKSPMRARRFFFFSACHFGHHQLTSLHTQTHTHWLDLISRARDQASLSSGYHPVRQPLPWSPSLWALSVHQIVHLVDDNAGLAMAGLTGTGCCCLARSPNLSSISAARFNWRHCALSQPAVAVVVVGRQQNPIRMCSPAFSPCTEIGLSVPQCAQCRVSDLLAVRGSGWRTEQLARRT